MNNIYCVDFDGTIVKHEYPEIGEPAPNAFEVLKELIARGDKIILYTMRSHKPHIQKIVSIDPKTNEEIVTKVERDTLQEAIDFCSKNGVEFYGINTNPSQKFWTKSPKAYGHIYIDDAGIGCPLLCDEGARPYVNWLEVRRILFSEEEK